MDFKNIDELKKAGFEGFKKMSELFVDSSAIPKIKGVYLVLNPNFKKAEYLQIGTVCDQTLDKQSKWPIKPKPSPKLVYVKDQKLITEEGKFTPELLSKFF